MGPTRLLLCGVIFYLLPILLLLLFLFLGTALLSLCSITTAAAAADAAAVGRERGPAEAQEVAEDIVFSHPSFFPPPLRVTALGEREESVAVAI